VAREGETGQPACGTPTSAGIRKGHHVLVVACDEYVWVLPSATRIVELVVVLDLTQATLLAFQEQVLMHNKFTDLGRQITGFVVIQAFVRGITLGCECKVLESLEKLEALLSAVSYAYL
jgi:hypothetical protein